jgi:thiamine-phosphate pyrophosphorylase
MKNKSEADYSLYLITDRKALGEKELISSIEAAIKGGVTLVQLREKNTNAYDYYNIAMKVKQLVTKYGVPLIINDRVDIALAVDADGVHLGPEDLPVCIARKLMGPRKIIGASANCVEEALIFQEQGADYLGVGALYPTATKNNTEHVSLEQLKLIKEAVHIPIVGIGGINLENAPLVKASGVNGIAVVSAVLARENVFEAACLLRDIGNNNY